MAAEWPGTDWKTARPEPGAARFMGDTK
jgi:hypothetical protein